MVVAELARVLCPGGVFSTLMFGNQPLEQNAFALFLDHFTHIDESVIRDVPVLIDHRLRSIGGLAAFFHPGTGFDALLVEDLEVDLDGSPEEVWHSLSGIYEGAVWSAEEVETLRARFLAGVESLRRADGTVPCRLASSS